jgi:hypothetical protein
MGYLPLLPALLLPVVFVVGVITRSRKPGADEALRRNRRYARNNILAGVLLAVLAFFFGFHR